MRHTHLINNIKNQTKAGIVSALLAAGLVLSGCGSSAQPAFTDTPATIVADETDAAGQPLAPLENGTGITETAETADTTDTPQLSSAAETSQDSSFSLESIPAYSGTPYVAVNGNVPYFTDDEMTTEAFESYSDLDAFGRCGVAYACAGQELMPTEDGESISEVKPSGWNNKEYDFVDGGWLYNRCHIIGFQLAGENANEKNLITGTRYMNVDGMLPFENMVADYIKETGNHVMYRVTPVYNGDEPVARGVLMEGKSVEDNGEGILFNVFVYNVQPGVEIDYATGDSQLADSTGNASAVTESSEASADGTYILNTNTKKFHLPGCASVADMDNDNKEEYNGSRDELVSAGYEPCGRCNS